MQTNTSSTTPYEAILKQYESLTKNLSLFNTLSEKVTALVSSNEAVNLYDIASALIRVFIETFSDITCAYFSDMQDAIIYEWILELYLLSQRSIQNTNAPITAAAIARIYADKSSTKGTSDSNAQMFSKKNKKVQDEFTKTCLAKTPAMLKYVKNRKYTIYKEFMRASSNHDFFCNVLSPLDTFFYTQFHSQSPFSHDNIETGITFKNLYDIVSEYLVLHENDQDGSIASELSAFYFEKMYHSISYSMCMNTLLNTENFSADLLKDYWGLYTFTKQFDTHNLSLIKFTQNTFLKQEAFFLPAEDNASLNFNAYLHFQIHHAFFLPALFYIFASLVHQKLSGDMFEIQNACKQYIKANCTKEYSYRSSLKKIFKQVGDLSHQLKQTKTTENTLKQSVLFCTPKNDSKHHKFNMQLFRFFYNQELPWLISSYITPPSLLVSLNIPNQAPFVQHYPETTEQLLIALYLSLKDNYDISRSRFVPTLERE